MQKARTKEKSNVAVA